MTTLNLRRHVTPTKINVKDKLLDENIKRLTPLLIEYLESMVPLKVGKIFNRLGYDGLETRSALLKLATIDKKISIKILNLETRRRRKMKIG